MWPGSWMHCTQPDPENPKALFRVSVPAVIVSLQQARRARVPSYWINMILPGPVSGHTMVREFCPFLDHKQISSLLPIRI